MSFTIVNKTLGFSSKDVAECSDQETLKRWLIAVEEDITKIEISVGKATAHEEATGEKPNPEWLERATTARRLQNMLRLRIQDRLSKVSILIPQATYANVFMDVARERLDTATFEKIQREASAIYESI